MATTTVTAHPARIRKASVSDVPRVATALSRAFFDDPVFRWGYPDDARRRELLPGFFSLFAETLQRHDEIYVIGQGTAAALWAPPRQAPVPEQEAERFGRRLEELSGANAERLFAINKVIEEHHPPGSYYFLQFIGVTPESQGAGIGSTLLGHMLERCDREGVRAYLDATSARNKRLYERHGFRASEAYGPEGGPPLWPMWRDPGT